MPERKEILDLLYEKPYLVGHWVGFTDLTQLHNEWLRSFLYGSADQTLLAHRGSYKTTVLSLFLALHIVLFPNEFVIFFRKTDDDTKEVIKQVGKILASGCVQKIVQILYNRPLEFIKRTDSEIHTNLCTSIRGSSQLIGLGIGTSITGKHADIVVTDDIVNIKDRVSAAERKLTRLQYMELQNIKNRSGRFINTGTPWHKEDAISLMPNVKKYDCYSTGLIGKEKLREIRDSMTDSLFAANYELKHIAAQDALFTNPQFTDKEELIYGGKSHVDAAYGGEDFTAYTAFNILPSGEIVGFGKLWQKHIEECEGEIAAYQERFRLGTIYCERNGDKGYLEKDLIARGLMCSSYYEKMNKYIKISTYLKKAWAQIKWLDCTDPEYISAILDYSENAAHDDAPDSAASLYRELTDGVQINLFRGGL